MMTPPKPGEIAHVHPPDADELTRHYELVGPDPMPGSKQICYRIIDRRTTKRDPYRFPGKEDEFTEKTTVNIMILGIEPELLRVVAEVAFSEYKRRIIYNAGMEWSRQREAQEKENGTQTPSLEEESDVECDNH